MVEWQLDCENCRHLTAAGLWAVFKLNANDILFAWQCVRKYSSTYASKGKLVLWLPNMASQQTVDKQSENRSKSNGEQNVGS